LFVGTKFAPHDKLPVQRGGNRLLRNPRRQNVKYKILAATIAMATSLTFASAANATLTISAVSPPILGSISATDANNALAFASGPVGSFNVNSITATGVNSFGGNGELLDIASLNVSTNGSGELIINVTETGLTSSSPVATLFGNFTANLTNATATRSIYLDTTNNGLTTTLLGSTTGAAGSYAQVEAGLTHPFSITELITINATGPGATLSADDNVKVPEPVSLSLLGTGLIGLGMVRRRKSTSV
jgi:hypothetical protein